MAEWAGALYCASYCNPDIWGYLLIRAAVKWLSGQVPCTVILGGLEDLVIVKARVVAGWAGALYCNIVVFVRVFVKSVL